MKRYFYVCITFISLSGVREFFGLHISLNNMLNVVAIQEHCEDKIVKGLIYTIVSFNELSESDWKIMGADASIVHTRKHE